MKRLGSGAGTVPEKMACLGTDLARKNIGKMVV